MTTNAERARRACHCLMCQRLSSADSRGCLAEAIAREIEQAIVEEREACAVIVETFVGAYSVNRLDDMLMNDPDGDLVKRDGAVAAIRARRS